MKAVKGSVEQRKLGRVGGVKKISDDMILDANEEDDCFLTMERIMDDKFSSSEDQSKQENPSSPKKESATSPKKEPTTPKKEPTTPTASSSPKEKEKEKEVEPTTPKKEETPTKQSLSPKAENSKKSKSKKETSPKKDSTKKEESPKKDETNTTNTNTTTTTTSTSTTTTNNNNKSESEAETAQKSTESGAEDKKKKIYLVKWEGIPSARGTWETEETLSCTSLIENWQNRGKTATRSKTSYNKFTPVSYTESTASTIASVAYSPPSPTKKRGRPPKIPTGNTPIDSKKRTLEDDTFASRKKSKFS